MAAMRMSTIQDIGFFIIAPMLYQAMTGVLLPTSHSRSVQVRMGKSTKKVKSLKATVKPTRPPKLSLISSKGRITSLYQNLNSLTIVFIPFLHA